MLNDLAVVTHLVSVQIKPKCGMTFEAMIFFSQCFEILFPKFHFEIMSDLKKKKSCQNCTELTCTFPELSQMMSSSLIIM